MANDITLDQAIPLYLRYRKSLGRRPATIRVNMQSLRSLAGALPPKIKVRAIKVQHIDQWRDDIAARITQDSVRNYLTGAATFFKWAMREGLITADPCADLERPKPSRPESRYLYPDEVHAVFEHGCQDIRDQLIVSFAVQEGLRIGEIAGLTFADFDLRRSRVMKVTGKGGKTRDVPMTAETEAVLNAYLAEYPRGTARAVVRGFPGSPASNRPLKTRTLSKMFQRICTDAGIKDHAFDGVSAHAFRHTCLTDVYEASSHDIKLVQQLAGHESMMTTQRYIKDIDASRMHEQMAGRDYRHRRVVKDESA